MTWLVRMCFQCSAGKSGLLMAYNLLDMAQARWRRLDGAHLLPLVRAGIDFVDGVQQREGQQETSESGVTTATQAVPYRMPLSESVGDTSAPPGVFSLLPDHDWQRHNDGKPGGTFPLNFIDTDSQFHCGDHGRDGREGDLQGESRETRPKTKVVAGAEREVMAPGPADIEHVWVCDVGGITVRGRSAREHHGAGSNWTSSDLGRRCRHAGNGTPGHESQALLRRRPRER
jgi:hypothetical protein